MLSMIKLWKICEIELVQDSQAMTYLVAIRKSKVALKFNKAAYAGMCI